MAKHAIEDEDSYEFHLERIRVVEMEGPVHHVRHRSLKHHHDHHSSRTIDLTSLEEEKEAEYWKDYQVKAQAQEQALEQANEDRESRIHTLYQSSAIVQHQTTTHGIMIDAGSTGSRLHVYEWEPRVLLNEQDIQEAVSGNKLSFPGTDTRWTERLRPGLSDFADRNDEDLIPALASYLSPLLDFAMVAREQDFRNFPTPKLRWTGVVWIFQQASGVQHFFGQCLQVIFSGKLLQRLHCLHELP